MSLDKSGGGSAEWTELWETFHRIREVDPSLREPYLATLDEKLRVEVQELLAAESSGDQMLENLVAGEMRLLHHSFMPDEEVAPEDVLADRFKVLRLLGKGGMGTVYEAWDQEIGAAVALKIMRPDLAQDSNARERFHREIQLARRVTHPNACRIFDLFHHDDLLFLTMELLPAETL
ncbi:MAG TPA: protein kinase, partial [Acidobacteriota bacterium]